MELTYRTVILAIFDAVTQFLPLSLRIAALGLRALVARLDAFDVKIFPMAAPEAVKVLVQAALDFLVEQLKDTPVMQRLAKYLASYIMTYLLDKVWDYFTTKGLVIDNQRPIVLMMHESKNIDHDLEVVLSES
jgi:hypothetical protein